MTQSLKFLRLTIPEQKVLVKASLLLVTIQFGLRLLSFNRQYQLLVRFGNLAPKSQKPNPAYLEQVVWAITKASHRLLGPNTCLPQALAAQFLLKRHGFPVRLVIGVRKDEFGAFKAHAWVENDGDIVIGGNHLEIEPYTTLPDLEDILV